MSKYREFRILCASNGFILTEPGDDEGSWGDRAETYVFEEKQTGDEKTDDVIRGAALASLLQRLVDELGYEIRVTVVGDSE